MITSRIKYLINALLGKTPIFPFCKEILNCMSKNTHSHNLGYSNNITLKTLLLC